MPKAVNTSGLLWELARDLGALLVFAEVSRRGPTLRHCIGNVLAPQGGHDYWPLSQQAAMLLARCLLLLARPHLPWSALRSLQHRYYGKSIPVNGSDAAAMQYLTVDAALTDYVRLIQVGSMNLGARWAGNGITSCL